MAGILEALDLHVLEPMAAFMVKHAHPNILPDKPVGTTVVASWYISPKQHIVEGLFYNLFFGYWALHFLRRLNNVGYFELAALHPPATTAKTKVWGKILTQVTLWTYLITVGYKWTRNELPFLLQPCHILNLTLIVMDFMPRNEDGTPSKTTTIMFQVYCCIMYSTVLALATPDLTDLYLPFEIPMFFWQHILLLLHPYFAIKLGMFSLLPYSLDLVMLAHCTFSVVHAALLQFCGWQTGLNLNYLWSPPPGPLDLFGRGYRVVMYGACLLFTYLTRVGLVEAIVDAFHLRPAAKVNTDVKLKEVRTKERSNSKEQ
eukprot:GFYU01007211.1.p1 GENE.GFYU01007211.1~~GFYU01007211.1.p1  ORF type:complete len:316 (-),score=98.13 GFYU01007211.1:40-987(-)